MRTFTASLALLVLASLAWIPVGRIVTSSVPAQVSGVNLWKNYSDPANDVQQFYTSNGTPLISGGGFVFVTNHTSVDLLQLRSWPAGGTPTCPGAGGAPANSVVLCIKLKGKVGTISNFTYRFDLYTDATNKTYYTVNYTGGSGAMWFSSNKTGFTARDITGNASIVSSSDNFRDELILTVNLALFPSVTAWDVDVMAQERDAYYTYRDFIYQVPGHPGTAPAAVLGHVYAEGTNNTLANVTLSTDVGGYTTLSNSTGAYVIYLAPGTYNLTAHKQGYQDVTYHAVVGQQSTVTHDFQLAPQSFVDQLGLLSLLIIVAIIVAGALAALFFLLRRRGRGNEARPPRSRPPTRP